MAESFGIMNQAYFVPRTLILSWINETLALNLVQIQQLGTGAVYCHLLDALYPHRVPLHRVNWKAKLEYEFIQNYKVLQAAMDRLGIDKKLEVEKLAKCKYQDNLEMIQWLKKYIQNQGGVNSSYDPVYRRSNCEVQLPIKASKLTINKENNAHYLPNTKNLRLQVCHTTRSTTQLLKNQSTQSLFNGLQSPKCGPSTMNRHSSRPSFCNNSMVQEEPLHTRTENKQQRSRAGSKVGLTLTTKPNSNISNTKNTKLTQQQKIDMIRKLLNDEEQDSGQLAEIRRLINQQTIQEDEDQVI